MPAFLEMNYGESLDHFHQRCVVPYPEETASRNAEIDEFVRFLQSRFHVGRYSPAEVLKGGSLGKGTAVRGSADIDLVVILNGLGSIDDLKSEREDLLDRLEEEVEKYHWKGKIKLDNRTRFSLCYNKTRTKRGKGKQITQQIDVLPALDIFNVYGNKGSVYREMKETRGTKVQLANQFSASLAPLQIDFVKTEPEAVKRVIRLLKFWKKERDVDIRSYTLELLTIHGARTKGWGMSTDILFRHVLTLLASCETLKVSFDDNYVSRHYTRTLQAPYVLDPANPYMDTLHGNDIDDIMTEASSMLKRL